MSPRLDLRCSRLLLSTQATLLGPRTGLLRLKPQHQPVTNSAPSKAPEPEGSGGNTPQATEGAPCAKQKLLAMMPCGSVVVFRFWLQLRHQYQISHEVQRGAQRASRVVLVPRPGSPVPSTPERREGLRAGYWAGPSELPERLSSSSAPRRASAGKAGNPFQTTQGNRLSSRSLLLPGRER